jgi:molybdopterin molybdotransferase
MKTRVSVDQALAILCAAGAARRMPEESLPLARADGHVLAMDAHAPLDLPPFDNAAMDGFALRRRDAGAGRPIPLAGVTLAGQPMARLPPGYCQRITTGAPLPQGADTVVIKENVREEGATVVIASLPEAGANVRRAGEDYRRGALALRQGMRLTPPRIGLLASFGMPAVSVVRAPRVRLYSTGDELVAAGRALAGGQIHDSNGPGLAAALRSLGIEPAGVGHMPDRLDAVRQTLQRIDDADLIVTCGGVSAGEADLLPGVLAELGEVLLWKVQIKPGMPFLFGRIGDALFCGLPGNPVSAMVTLLVLVAPMLDAMRGASETPPELWARLRSPLSKRHGRREYRRGFLRCEASGQLQVDQSPFQGSAMQRGLVEGEVLIELPEDGREWQAGDPLRVHRMPWT